MIHLQIDGREIAVPEGASVLDAAAALGIAIPTLCYDRACTPFTSCLVCVVRDDRAGRLIPSCAAPAEENMRILTGSADVIEARRIAVELLLGEHAGDCEAPCRRACPLRLDAPAMLRLVRAGNMPAAARLLREFVALPRVVGRVCHAPCENVCRRRSKDDSLAILSVERHVSEAEDPGVYVPAPGGPAVAIVGAGPAGLAAAFALCRGGCRCTVFDALAEAGGSLLPIDDSRLPAEALQSDLAFLRRLGISFRLGVRVDKDIATDALRREFAAVVLATGAGGDIPLGDFDLHAPPAGGHATGAVLVDDRGLFACGSAVRSRPQVVQAMADGASAAQRALSFVMRSPLPHVRFDSHLGRVDDRELEEFMKEAAAAPRVSTAARERGLTPAEAAGEGARCLICDCRKRDGCRLRTAADDTHASQGAFRGEQRPRFEKIVQHADVIYEPGKCIRCGLCVQLTAKDKEKLGLTFIGRGFDVRIGVPFGESMSDALRSTAARCVEACPTAALAFRASSERP